MGRSRGLLCPIRLQIKPRRFDRCMPHGMVVMQTIAAGMRELTENYRVVMGATVPGFPWLIAAR
ncbi:hypothetical protein Rcae01_04790 [Novipirellula caenicola]|uniref:Uncharacterized protein n=1 Tax=Novipirellula caenicola TaxID=1536901 RepID=A0ABP9VWS4_9BACT